MHAHRAIVGGGLVQPEIPIPRRPANVHKEAATRNAYPIAPNICGQRGLVPPSMLHQKRMHAHRAIVERGACSHLKFPFAGARPTYTRQRQLGTPERDRSKTLRTEGSNQTWYVASKAHACPPCDCRGGPCPTLNSHSQAPGQRTQGSGNSERLPDRFKNLWTEGSCPTKYVTPKAHACPPPRDCRGGGLFSPEIPIRWRPAYVHKAAATRKA